jgi:hypothetical protein
MAIADPYFDKVALLINGDSIQDKSKYSTGNNAVSATGVSIVTDQVLYGASSIRFNQSVNSTDKFIAISNTAGISKVVEGDFTIEFSVRFNSFSGLGVSGTANYILGGTQRTSEIHVYVSTTEVSLAIGPNYINWAVGSPSTGVWYSYKFTRSGSTVSLCINGVLSSATQTGPGIPPAAPAYVDAQYIGKSMSTTNINYATCDMWLSSMRITGAARSEFQTAVFPTYAAQITGNVIESTAITNWTITGVSITGLVATTTTTGSTYTLNCPSLEPYNITLSPKIDKAWTATTAITVGTYVTAAIPDSNPHIWKCVSITSSGLTGATEPSWNIGTPTLDNQVTWDYVSPLMNPISIGPKIPS